MVDNWGTGFPDFTGETAISGTASVSGNVVGISGEVSMSGSVSIINNYMVKAEVLVITAGSGGQALGSGLTTSGFVVQQVTIKIPEVQVSGTNSYGVYFNSGSTAPVVYIGGCSNERPYPGGPFICSGKGYPMAPGESKVYLVNSLDYLYAAAAISGNPLSYIVEMR